MFLFFVQIAATTLSLSELKLTEGNNVLIMGAHPYERRRFDPAFPQQNIVFWNANYDRDLGSEGTTEEKFEAGAPTCHIFADFNDIGNLQQVSKVAGGKFGEIWFDVGVIDYIRWAKSHWEKILGLLAPEGKLFFNMSVPLETSFGCLSFDEKHPESNQGRKQGWSHTEKDLPELFQAWLPKDGICMERQRVDGYFTYLCNNPPCSSDCFTQTEPSSPPKKNCQHDWHKCEGQCVDPKVVSEDWRKLLKMSEADFMPIYIGFVQRFLGNEFHVQAYTAGYPFELSLFQETPSHLVQVTRLV